MFLHSASASASLRPAYRSPLGHELEDSPWLHSQRTGARANTDWRQPAEEPGLSPRFQSLYNNALRRSQVVWRQAYTESRTGRAPAPPRQDIASESLTETKDQLLADQGWPLGGRHGGRVVGSLRHSAAMFIPWLIS
jgi:hypothetical protein